MTILHHSYSTNGVRPLIDPVWGYVDSQNNVVARWQYDAWGNVIAEDVSVPALARLRYRFQSREWSAATGLINFRMRWYDAETGRWLSKDPIGLSGGLNLYAFCENDPVNREDSIGLCEDEKSIWDKIKNDIHVWWEAFKKGVGPSAVGEVSEALSATANLTTVLGQGAEKNKMEKALENLESYDQSEIEKIESRFRRWSNASQNQADLIKP